MIFSTPSPSPSSVEADITLPAARQIDTLLPMLDEITERIALHRDAFLSATKSRKDWKACYDSLGSLASSSGAGLGWGRFFALALKYDRRDAAEAILVASRVTSIGCPRFLNQMTKSLNTEGRLDLWRPGLVIIRDFCQKLSIHDASLMEASSSPPMSGISGIDPISRVPSVEEKYNRELRAARSWWEFGSSLPALLKDQPVDGEPDLDVFFPVLINALETIPSLRPFSAFCLVGFGQALIGSYIGRSFNRSSMDFANDLIVSSRPLIGYLSGGEAAAVLRRIADFSVMKSQEGQPFAPLNTFAQLLIESHPDLSLDDWFRSGAPGEINLPSTDRAGIPTTLEGWHAIRQEFLSASSGTVDEPDQALMETREFVIDKYLNSGKGQRRSMCDSYELITSWIGATRGSELSADTVAALSLLLDGRSANFPCLISAMDKAKLSSVAIDRPVSGSVCDAAPTCPSPRPRMM